VPAEGNGDLQTLICVLVARPRRCLTLSNPVPWQNWMAAYLGYTLRMRTLFRGWPIMVNDTHTRRRSIPLKLCLCIVRFLRHSVSKMEWPWNRGRSTSLKMAPFDRSYTSFYWSAIVSIALLYHFRIIWRWIIVILKCGLEVTQYYSNWYHSKAWITCIARYLPGNGSKSDLTK